MNNIIDKFNGEYSFLSNFWEETFMCNGVIYPTVEHYYQSEKTTMDLTPTTTWTNDIKLGKRKSDNATIWLYAPTWDCEWYWGFGYLGNQWEHYHLNGYANGRNINMYDALKTDYILNPIIEKYLWLFCELLNTAYTFKETAEVYHRGGSNYTKNPLSDLIKNETEWRRINWVVLPEIFNKVGEIYGE